MNYCGKQFERESALEPHGHYAARLMGANPHTSLSLSLRFLYVYVCEWVVCSSVIYAVWCLCVCVRQMCDECGCNSSVEMG